MQFCVLFFTDHYIMSLFPCHYKAFKNGCVVQCLPGRKRVGGGRNVSKGVNCMMKRGLTSDGEHTMQ